jgi:TetR/AcrR family transcriptional repressor of nem operon
MRYAKDHKLRTRGRITENAHRLFSQKGYAATSIDEIMRACGLTRGGFYAHFKSKSQLYRTAISVDRPGVEQRRDPFQTADDDSWIDAMLDEYLDVERATHNPAASRFAFLAMDVANPRAEVRSAYTHAFKVMSEKLRDRVAAHLPCRETSILALAAMLVGTIAVAQTMDDMALKADLVASCKHNAKALLLDGEREHVPPVYFWISAPPAARRGLC